MAPVLEPIVCYTESSKRCAIISIDQRLFTFDAFVRMKLQEEEDVGLFVQSTVILGQSLVLHFHEHSFPFYCSFMSLWKSHHKVVFSLFCSFLFHFFLPFFSSLRTHLWIS